MKLLVVLILLTLAITCATHLFTDNNVEARIRNLLQTFKAKTEYNDRAKGNNFQRKGNMNSRESDAKESNDKESTIHIQKLESDVVDPNSKFMELADSFQVLRYGEKIRPNDLHPEDSDQVKAQKQDTHFLTHQQKVELGLESEKEDEGHGSVSKKAAFTVENVLWPKGIVPYEIDTTSLTDPTAIPVIKQAIEIFNSTTCVQFLPHTPELETKVGHTNFVRFYSGSGCSSSVGMKQSGQSLSLKQPGCLGVGTALHEMGHTIGQWHEQSRTDRDYHVNLKWDILGTKEQNGVDYGKFETRDYRPYDYESIMQYRTEDGLEVLQPELEFLTRDATNNLSFYDIAQITTAYRCTEKCINPPKCENGGFLNFKCECFCPRGLTGKTCESVENAEVCGGIVNLIVGKEITITSPNFPYSYATGTKCVWLLRAPKDFRVRVDVDVFHLPVVESNNRCYHWLEVRYNLVGQTGIRKCGTTSGDTWVTSQWGEQNLMLLIFDSVFGKQHNAEKGFSLRARTINKGCVPNPCIKGVCKDCADGTFKCVCDPGFEGKLCDTLEATATFECTFESARSNACFMRNVQGDDFDWIVYSGPTMSELTGPDTAHSGENYIYAEGSYPRKPNDRAVLETDLNFPAGDYCLTFYYNMFGADMGSLTVAAKDSKGDRQLWAKSGNQGSNWVQGSVEMSIAINTKVRFEAKRGNNWESDVALDDIKISPGLCEKPKPLNCMTTIKGTDYIGNIHTTSGGQTCQRWDSNTPHQHSYHDYDKNENYCRNTRGDAERPWCFTTNPDLRWDYCTVPRCEVEECLRSKNGYEYMGSKNITAMGKRCSTRSDGTNACRAKANDPAPWCYTVDPNVVWDTCVLPKCTSKPKECLSTANGMDYFGMVSKTKSGKTCQAWAKQEPHQHEFWAMEDQGNYCRNPNGESAPWCYTTDPNINYELCDIPLCEVLKCLSNPCLNGGRCEEVSGGFKCTCQLGYAGTTCETRVRNEDCKRSKSGYEYNGMISTTVGKRTCQRWALDTPQDHNYNYVDGENYCRNPSKDSGGPWCFTTDPNKRFEYCDVPFCTTPAKECVQSENGFDYFGSVRRTVGGIPCQKWSEQTPHPHSYGYMVDQDDYCRNPYNEAKFPWCYTMDPNLKWDYCDIPRC